MKFTTAFITMLALAGFASAQTTPAQAGSQPMTQTAGSNSGESNSTDAQEMQQLQSQFSQDPAFGDVQVSVTNHTALLTGTVASKDIRARAEQLAKSVKGISSVRDELTINTNASKPNNNPTTAGAPTPNANAATVNSATGETNTEQTSTPANAASPAVQNQTPAPSASAPATTGGVTGAAVGTPSTSPAPAATAPSAIGANAAPAGASTNIESIENASTLQGQIQNAMQNEPTLRNDQINVNVSESTIELSGTVQSGKEKQTADRIANSFAGNRRVRDRITVGRGGASSATPGANDLGANPARRSQGSNPQPNQNNQNPSSNDAAAKGDASSNPR